MSDATVLVIEDDSDICGLVAALVERAGMVAVQAADGRAGIRSFFDERPDLVVLDLGLPELDGWEVLDRIRDVSDVPILVLTAFGEQRDRVRGLDSGADDYVTKPFGKEELVSRVRALLRRRRAAPMPEPEVVSDGSISVDEAQRRVEVAGAELVLSPTEFRLLVTLMRNRGRVVSQLQLLEAVWGNTEADPRQVRLYVSYLRRKLRAIGGVEPIETVRGFGYRYRAATSVSETAAPATA